MTKKTIVILLAALCAHFVEPSPLVSAPFGQMKGVEKTAQNGKPYIAFLGIPYAKPPVEDLRFAKPEPYPTFDSVFDASNHGASCIQSPYFLPPEIRLSEDCLFLNVFVKEINPGKLRKVLFWIHGGGFIMGSSFGHDMGSLLTDHDIIVVTVNYRLGVLGFLSTENEAAPGNYGLWDQIMALTWVKENIAAFGGDPKDITISGESAGGTSASLVALAPQAKGLFSKVICNSGTATSLFAKSVDAKADAINVAKKANCLPVDADELIDVSRSREIIECLRSVPAEELSKDVLFRLYRASFVPRVDGDLIPRTPLDLLQDARYLESINFYDTPYFITYNNNEQQGPEVLYNLYKSFHYSRENLTMEEKDSQWEETIQLATMFNVADRLDIKDPTKELVSLVYDWYERRKGRDLVLPTLLSDLFFSVASFDVLDALAKGKSSKVWSLYFNYYPQFMKGVFKGMIHGMDLAFLLDISLEDIDKITNAGVQGEFSKENQEIKSLYSAMFAEFVKYGNPEKPILTKLPNGWPTYDLLTAKYLDYNDKPMVLSHLDREKRELWGKILPNISNNIHKETKHLEL